MLCSNGAVLVVTTPTYAQGDAQHGWNKTLGSLEWSNGGPLYAYLQDLSQSWFQKIALAEMRKKYGPPPYLLLDPDGRVREALGFAPSATVAAVYAPGGRLVKLEPGPPTPERARELWALARKHFEAQRGASHAAPGPRTGTPP